MSSAMLTETSCKRRSISAKSKVNARIWDTGGRGSGVPPAIALDEAGEPAFLHVLSEGDLKTHTYYYVRRENGRWRQTAICGSNHQWNSGHLAGIGMA